MLARPHSIFARYFSLCLSISSAIAAVDHDPIRSSAALVAQLAHEDDCTVVVRSGTEDLCTLVGTLTPHPQSDITPNVYLYQSKIQKAAGVHLDHDSSQMIQKKIQHAWTVLNPVLTCDSFGFNVPKGSLLKYAIAKKSNDFIHDATREWKLPLNLYADDGTTVLDYIGRELEKAKGTANEPVYRRYYRQFKDAGAKHRKDLTDKDAQVDPYDTEIRPLLAVWDKACYFSEDLAAVKRQTKWGYVDRRHQIIIEPKYDGAFSFSDGRAVVVKDGKWGYINFEGKEVIPLRYSGARVFDHGEAEVSENGNDWFTIQLDGKRK